MTSEQSLWIYFFQAGPVVKAVMLLLLAASVASWTVIFQRGMLFKKIKKMVAAFEQEFWSGVELTGLYQRLKKSTTDKGALANIFKAGFGEFARLREHTEGHHPQALESVQRAMRIATNKEMDKLQQHLSFLASVASASPYIGLFGTVWGIMTAFHALGGVQQATIAMVAPGISEALIATAMGLFAAIPAVLAYNRYTTTVEQLDSQFTIFQQELSSIVARQLQGK